MVNLTPERRSAIRQPLGLARVPAFQRQALLYGKMVAAQPFRKHRAGLLLCMLAPASGAAVSCALPRPQAEMDASGHAGRS
jgi:hypothetical protein